MSEHQPASVHTNPPESATQRVNAEELADLIVKSSNIAAITGAGASAESGIPTFRDPNDGIWQKYSVTDCATIWGFKRHPERLWRMLSEFVESKEALPNPTHYALSKLEKMGKLTGIITQNVDRLHQDAGSKNVVEYHGSLMETICMKCGDTAPLDKKKVGSASFRADLPPKCRCGGILKPNAVLFGEWIPSSANQEAERLASQCDLLLVIGTSGTVAPASNLGWTAARRGAKVVEVNIEPTALTNKLSDFLFESKSSRLMDVVQLVENTLTPPVGNEKMLATPNVTDP